MTQKTPLLSIIIPIYGVEKYIDDCLASLVSQTRGYDTLEIICVNDHTQDNSMQIVERYAKKYPDTFVLLNHQTNKGPGGARNTGIKNASGAYITFVDADDYVGHDAYELILKKMQSETIDLTMYSYEHFSSDNSSYNYNPSYTIYSVNDIITHKDLSNYPEHIFALNVWNMVISQTLMRHLPPFPENQTFNEDAQFALQARLRARKIFLTDKVTYHYRKRDDNASATQRSHADLQSYDDHLAYHISLLKMKKDFPELTYAVDWYNVRNWYKFMHAILLNKVSLESQKANEFLTKTKQLYRDIPQNFSFPRTGLYNRNMVTVIHKDKSLEETKKDYQRRYYWLHLFYSTKKRLHL